MTTTKTNAIAVARPTIIRTPRCIASERCHTKVSWSETLPTETEIVDGLASTGAALDCGTGRATAPITTPNAIATRSAGPRADGGKVAWAASDKIGRAHV